MTSSCFPGRDLGHGDLEDGIHAVSLQPRWWVPQSWWHHADLHCVLVSSKHMSKLSYLVEFVYFIHNYTCAVWLSLLPTVPRTLGPGQQCWPLHPLQSQWVDEERGFCKDTGCEPVGRDWGDSEHAALSEECKGPSGQCFQRLVLNTYIWWWLLHLQVWHWVILGFPQVMTGMWVSERLIGTGFYLIKTIRRPSWRGHALALGFYNCLLVREGDHSPGIHFHVSSKGRVKAVVS